MHRNLVTVSGGYFICKNRKLSKKFREKKKVSGWRINGTYEFNPAAGPGPSVFHLGIWGFRFQETCRRWWYYRLRIWILIPIYVCPENSFRCSDKMKGFIEGAIGTQEQLSQKIGLLKFQSTDWVSRRRSSAVLNNP